MNHLSNRIDKQNIKKAKEIIAQATQISIIPHTGPDGDAIGASLALFQYLKKKEKQVKIIAPNDYPLFLNWLPYNNEIAVFLHQQKGTTAYINKSDLIFVIDHNSFKRSGDLNELLTKSTAKKIMIDHHPYPEAEVDVSFSDTNMCATCELMYEFIEAMGDKAMIDTPIATCLYTGIITDTGGLSYNSSNPETYEIVGNLLRTGIDKATIHSNLYDNFSADRMKLLGHCLDAGLEVLPQCQAAIIRLEKNDLKKFNHTDGDTEGVVNYPLSIKNIVISAIFIEKDDMVKISFRSKGDVPINEVAAKYFNGGGHRNAAGGRTTLSLNEAIEKFKQVLPDFYREINS